MAVPKKAETLHNRLQEFIDSEMPTSNRKSKSRVYNYISEFVSYCQLKGNNISREHIISYCNLLAEKKQSRSLIAAKITTIKRFLQWMFRMDYTDKMWYEYFPKVKQAPPGEVKIIGHEEYMRIRKCCYTKDQEWIIILAYCTGMRLGDCCTLRWSHVDMEDMTIKKQINKNRHNTGAYTHIPYGPGSDVHQFITDLWDRRHEHYIDDDNPVCPEMYLSYVGNWDSPKDSFKRIFIRAGIHDRTFRNFRSTFESLIANSGMNMALATKITGRTDVKSLLRYIRPDMEVAREGIARALELHTTVKGFA